MTVHQWDEFELHSANVTFLVEENEINDICICLFSRNCFERNIAVTIRMYLQTFHFRLVQCSQQQPEFKEGKRRYNQTLHCLIHFLERKSNLQSFSLPGRLSVALSYSAALAFHLISFYWQSHQFWRRIFVWCLECMHVLCVHAAHSLRLLWLCCKSDKWCECGSFDGSAAIANFCILYCKLYMRRSHERADGFAVCDTSICLTTKSICNTPHTWINEMAIIYVGLKKRQENRTEIAELTWNVRYSRDISNGRVHRTVSPIPNYSSSILLTDYVWPNSDRCIHQTIQTAIHILRIPLEWIWQNGQTRCAIN